MRRSLYRVGRNLSNQNKVYSFKRTCQLQPYYVDANGALQPQTTTPYAVSNYIVAGKITYGNFVFKLNDLPNATDITNLYERYKITGVKLKFIPVMGTSIDVDRATSAAVMAPFAIAINRGPYTTAADTKDFNGIIEQQDARIYTAAKPFNVYIPYPKFYAPADGIVAAQEKTGWLSTKNPAVNHTGVQWAFGLTTTSEFTYMQFRVYATYYVKCCNPQ